MNKTMMTALAMLVSMVAGLSGCTVAPANSKTVFAKEAQTAIAKAQPVADGKLLEGQAPVGKPQATQSAQAKRNGEDLSLDGQISDVLDGLSSTLDDGSYANYHVFDGEPGQEYEARMESSAFDAYLLVVEGDSVVLAENDDHGGSVNARVRFQMPRSGAVNIIANSAFAGETGPYVLRINRITPEQEAGTLQIGSVVTGALHPGSQRFEQDDTLIDWWTFPVQRGREYEIRMESEEFDAYLLIHDNNGNMVATDDDSGGVLNALVRITAPADGTLRVGANQAMRGDGGRYRLMVTAVAPLVIPTGGARDGRYALVIGVADYPGVNNDLPLVENDVIAVQAMLKNDFGYANSQIFVLRNEQATRNNVVRAVREFLGQAGPDGHALLYYSGHGTQTETNEALVAPIDPEADDKDEAMVLYDGLLLDDEIGYLLRTLDAGSMTVLFDSCYSGTGARGDGMKFAEFKDVTTFAPLPKNYLTDGWSAPKEWTLGDEGFFGPLELDRRVTFIAASAEDEVAWIGQDLDMSLFTYMLVNRAPAHRDLDIEEFISRFAPSVYDYALDRFSKPQTVNGEWAGSPRKVSQLIGGRR